MRDLFAIDFFAKNDAGIVTDGDYVEVFMKCFDGGNSGMKYFFLGKYSDFLTGSK